MSDNPVRFAYVGCGFMGQMVHIPNFAAQPNCRFMALAEPRQELAAKVAARYGIPKVYRTHQEIAADPEIEAVGVSSPFVLQSRITEDLLATGKHVYMEKPMAVTVKRAQSMLAAAKKGKSRLMVAYMKRYDTGNLLIKSQIDAWRKNGEMGKITFARAHGFCGAWTYGIDQNIPFEQSKDQPPAMPDEYPDWLPKDWWNNYIGYLQQYTHNYNLLRWWLGDVEGNVNIKQVELDEKGHSGVVLAEINGVRVSIESGSLANHVWDEQTQVYFEKAWLRGEGATLMHKETPAKVEIYEGPRDPHLASGAKITQHFTPAAWAYREEAKHFLENVRSGQPFRSSGEDSLHDVRLFETIYQKFLAQR
ncbi:MAG TPA: Gfo/Idh/MocA family oxidoreductase [Tepidisphaeraceae bacterium]|jgi:predicted dehydrogenase